MAASSAPGGQQAQQNLRLPHLDRLLSRLNLVHTDTGLETDYAPPHERALARLLGLPERATPWAAYRQHVSGQACAWLTPCHWQIGADHVTLLHPDQLALSEADSRTLMDIIGQWMAQDGLSLTWVAPTLWLASGPLFADLECAPIERVLGRDVRMWMPRGPRGTLVQRLHSEVQMLLYTHPWSEARAAQGQLAVNAFWVHGAGLLPALPPNTEAATTEPEMPMALHEAALRQDWAAWARAWQQLDAGPVSALLDHVARGGTAELTLCGERTSLHWSNAHRSLGDKVVSLFRPKRFADVREQL